jgi:NitT/TauT family transport system substrate-binding protein
MRERRREILRIFAAAGAAAIAGIGSKSTRAEPPPETTRIRLAKVPSICVAPQYVAEDLLRAEGFYRYLVRRFRHGGRWGPGAQMMSEGGSDIGMNFAAPLVIGLDRGAGISLLGGVHVGCFELFGSARVGSIKDLKGKTVSVLAKESAQHVFLASIATSVGLDPTVISNGSFSRRRKASSCSPRARVDAYLGFPPDPQELREKKIGRMLLSSAIDRPWSQYFCCMVAANRDWVHKHPIAAKRALRAILKGSELCASDPELGVRAYLAQGYTPNPEHARQALRELPYGHWRDYNPEETVRFYALRLREAGMIKNPPQKLISQGTDWRALDQLKRELKI